MSLRTKSRIPASTSVTAARLVSMVSVSVPSVFSGRMAFIVVPLFALSAARVSPARRRQSGLGRRILAATWPRCGKGGPFVGFAVAYGYGSLNAAAPNFLVPHGEEREARGGRRCAPPREPCRPGSRSRASILRDALRWSAPQDEGESGPTSSS